MANKTEGEVLLEALDWSDEYAHGNIGGPPRLRLAELARSGRLDFFARHLG